MGRFHIALAVHGFVVFPVEDGTAGDTDFEDFGVGEHEVRRHESAEAPTVHTDAGGVDIGEGAEVFDAFHLVGDLNAAEVAVGAAFELETAIARSAIVENKRGRSRGWPCSIPTDGLGSSTTPLTLVAWGPP